MRPEFESTQKRHDVSLTRQWHQDSRTFDSLGTSMKEPIYIVDGVGTPFAKAGTILADSEAVDLGKTALAILVARSGIDPAQIEEVIIGCVSQPADSANVG